MNRFLATVLSKLNVVMAVIFMIIAIGGGAVREGVAGAFGGIVGGSVMVIVVCGTLAVVLDIRAALREIAQTLKEQTQ